MDDDEPLSHSEKVDRFAEQLRKLVDYFRDEYSVTLAEAVGVLEVEKLRRTHDAFLANDEEEADE